MLKSYITIALRKLSRERLYVSINIVSLALGIASFLILALYLQSELTYDQHNVNHERIYRMTAHFGTADGRVDRFAVSQVGFGPMLVADYPQLGKQVRFRPSQQSVLRYEEKEKKWDDIYLADPTVFDIFTHKVLYGDIKKAFDNPRSLAISESFSKYYFGDENPIGKTIVGPSMSYQITLVFADLPENSHLKYNALFPMALMDVFDPNFSKSYQNTLFNVGIYTYFMVPEGFKPAELTTLSKQFVEAHMRTGLTRFKSEFEARYQRLADIHFGEKLDGDRPSGNIFYIYGFMAVAIFILLVACINYMNLATARATKRAKEVGMRKVLGASQGQLIAQFLGESFTFTFVALLVGLLFVEVALAATPIGALMGKEHLLGELNSPAALLGAVGVSIAVALIAGLYPAFYLSSISPLAALTQVKRSWRTGFTMRQALVVSQLIISIGVIACTFLMTDQMKYINEKPLGFGKENRLVVTLRGYDVVKNVKTLKNELRAQPNVIDVTTISIVPGTGNWVNLFPVETNEGTFEPTSADRIAIGMNFIQAMGLELVAGRGFSEEIATDAREATLVNESFVKKMGWKEPIGKRFQMGGPGNFIRVVGVVKDFHYSSLHNAIGPMAINPINDAIGPVPELQKALTTTSIIVVMKGENIRKTVDSVEAVIAKFDPKFIFEPEFLEDRLTDLYKSESNLMKLTGIFAGICIFISIMGLFGLAAFTTEQRTKEIGIRKVLGASDGQIVGLLCKHLAPLIAIAAIPASILGYYAIDKWLTRFAYHTDISWLTFVVATVLVTLVALATVAMQSLQTARAEPVDALRYE
ncbi:MAG TPA: FtsX-like permease family protein [Steroidobacteraceae bacterium]|nr:FtsX-like permease family protein [Steroidobacteraceae bacterium]